MSAGITASSKENNFSKPPEMGGFFIGRKGVDRGNKGVLMVDFGGKWSKVVH
jgi:hypothetical protein